MVKEIAPEWSSGEQNEAEGVLKAGAAALGGAAMSDKIASVMSGGGRAEAAVAGGKVAHRGSKPAWVPTIKRRWM